MTKIQQIQALLGLTPDGVWGKVSQYVLDGAAGKMPASFFAGPKDIAAYKEWFAKYKAQGYSDADAQEMAFSKGDNGIGFTGLDVTDESIPYCALPPEVWMQKWGSKQNASKRPVRITYQDKQFIAYLGDTMPHISNRENEAGIDLAPGCAKILGVTDENTMLPNVAWEWV